MFSRQWPLQQLRMPPQWSTCGTSVDHWITGGLRLIANQDMFFKTTEKSEAFFENNMPLIFNKLLSGQNYSPLRQEFLKLCFFQSKKSFNHYK